MFYENKKQGMTKIACLNNVSLHIGERLVLPSGKKYRRSMMVLRQILNNDSMNNDKVKGYDSLLGSTVNLRAPEYFGENYYKDAILKVCKQRDICSFEEIFESHFENCKKIGEGVFGEVFSFERESGLNVLKVIPIEGNTCVNGENQKCFEEIYSELIISHVLDKLRQGDKEFMTEGFIDLVKAWLVRGRYPDTLLELWHEFDNLKGSENDSPEIFLDDQLYLVLELGNAGTDLECYSFTNASQAVSVLKQVACSLAVAEAKHDFEHRDLHWGNVLVSKTLKSSISCILNGQTYDLKTEGVKATIIDYTLSSITTNGGSRVYNDIGMSPDIFTATGDYQFDIYRHMREDLGVLGGDVEGEALLVEPDIGNGLVV
ncbi:hypothetical protein AAG570_009892 [Ranatra chinensis]|uniref:Protein kinase domain-containing protein n=1 Tax=Ranatra chinensis TaxID=642074 RepID=A0ABD0YQE4_9HEMI